MHYPHAVAHLRVTTIPFDVRAPLVVGALLALSACSDMPLTPTMPGTEPGEAGAVAGPSAPAPAIPVPATSVNPLEGAKLFVEATSNASRQAAEWRQTRPADAAYLDRIASQPQANWFGDWNPEPYAIVNQTTSRIRQSGALPVYVLYNIPFRDCGLYSSGGARSASEYLHWISEVARGIGAEPAVVVLEPDAVAGMDCLSAAEQDNRISMVRSAVETLKRAGRISVYIDAGNARWHSASTIAERLQRAGIGIADGFALNVSNFLSNEESIGYGDAVSDLTGGKHFVIDTSRNGLGPAADLNWCNPDGRALGRNPTTQTGHATVDGFFWLKAPGESDGECNGGPRAGEWWAEYALGLARRAA